MAALERDPLIDEILDARQEFARGQTAAFEGYRNHAHRIYNFARAIASFSPDDRDKLAIAAAFHDLYVFDGLDYIEPSIEEAGRYLRESGRVGWDREVALMIAIHHKVRRYHGEHAKLVEPFRRADWNDFTMGLVRGGIPRALRRAAADELPVRDFAPKTIVRLTVAWVPRHPLRPAPGVPRRGSATPHRPRLTVAELARAGSEALILFAADKIARLGERRDVPSVDPRRIEHLRLCTRLIEDRLLDSPLTAELLAMQVDVARGENVA